MAASPNSLILEAVAGPHPMRVELREPRQLVLGRSAGSDVQLDDPTSIVSRRHAIIEPDVEGSWRLTDLASRHGTRLNGVAITADRAVPMRLGDLISIGPWTLMVGGPQQTGNTSGLRTLTDDDRATDGAGVRTVRANAVADAALAGERVQLLLQVAEVIHRADTLPKLAEAVIEKLAAGTRFGNVAMLRPMAGDGSVEVIALRTESGVHPIQFRFSRSILQQASAGVIAVRSRVDAPVSDDHSIAQLDISEALCVPLLADGVVLAMLYLDNRHGRRSGRGGGDDQAFATAVGRIAGLAIRNLMQLDYGIRLAAAEAEIGAAASMQELILPEASGVVGAVEYAGRCRAGRVVSGDFFDVVPMPHGRTAIVIGDVSGKGVGASVLATLTQGFLRGILGGSPAPDEAAKALNSFLGARAEMEHFVTLWMGIIDPEARRVRYVDAGHGYAWLLRPGGETQPLNEGGGPPLGAIPHPNYVVAEAELPDGSVVLLSSDGVIEQPAATGTDDRFGTDRLVAVADASLPLETLIEQIYTAVFAFAAASDLADDATVVVGRAAAASSPTAP